MLTHTASARLFSRVLVCFLTLALLVSGFTVLPVTAATEEGPLASRLINVVYDDSNSMIAWNDPDYGHRKTTAWSEAKYSLMILYAMAQSDDVMNVYYMSDFKDNQDAQAGLKDLASKTDAEKIANIQKILNKITDTHATWFESIRRAYNDLVADGGSYDERHLIVLTDGNNFTGGENEEDLNALFASAETDGIKVTYLAIGENTLKPTETEDSVRVFNAVPDNPTGEDSILNRIKEVAMRVFQRNDNPGENGLLTLNFPVSEIVVFAQGANVSVGEIDGTVKSSFSAALTDADKDKASATPDNTDIQGEKNITVAKGLGGEVAVFKPASGEYLSEGTYTLDVKNATTYSVYYKPYLDVVLTITDKDGMVVKDGDDVDVGTYTVDYALTYPEGHALHGTPIKDLGFEVDYTLSVLSGSTPQTLKGPGPKEINPEEGNLVVTVIAKYLTYISTDTSVHFTVTDRNIYELKVTLDPEKRDYILSEMESVKDGYTVKVTHEDGSALTADEWRRCSLELTSEGVDFFDPVKNNDHSFTVRPKLKNGNYEATGSGEVPFKAIAVITEADRITHKSSADGIADIYNDVLAVGKDGGLKVTITDITPGSIKSDSFNSPQPTARVTITWNGNPLTKAQYDALTLTADMKKPVTVTDDNGNEVELIAISDIALDPFTADAPATATLTFVAQGSAETQRTTLKGKGGFTVTATIEREGVTVTDTDEGKLNIGRAWTPWEIIGIIGAIVFFAGYIPGIKKYLPFKITYKPTLIATEETCYPYINPLALLSMIIPWVPMISSVSVDYKFSVKNPDGKTKKISATATLKLRARTLWRTAFLLNAVEHFEEDGISVDSAASELTNYLSAVKNGDRDAKRPRVYLDLKNSKLKKSSREIVRFFS